MNRTTRHAALTLLMLAAITRTISGQVGGDLLNEVPLTPIPPDMTLEEYRDMNRRLTVGLLLTAVPIPGLIHAYAGEKRTQYLLLATAVGGLLSVVAGAALTESGDFPTSNYDVMILNPDGGEQELRFAKVPVAISGSDTTYRLEEFFRRREGPGTLLVVLGVGLIEGTYLYDVLHGIKLIEQKRDLVRFNYGKRLSIGLSPDMHLEQQVALLTLSLQL